MVHARAGMRQANMPDEADVLWMHGSESTRPVTMKLPNLTPMAGRSLRTTASRCLTFLFFSALMFTARGGESAERSLILGERQFGEKLRMAERPRDGAEQARQVHLLLQEGRFSSAQVKAMAKTFAQEDARYDFVVAAYSRTVDPENFYEVYDAFTSFSKVLRLHDQLQPPRPAPAPTSRPALQPVGDEAMAEIVKSVRAEGLEDTKKTLARQVFTGRRRFLSRQVCEVVKAFAFDEGRLEVAKLAYDSVIDPENYFLVNQAFSFASTKDSLARFLESRRAEDLRQRGR